MNQSLWLNSSITVNNNYIYVKNWENCGITYIKDILNKNGSFLTHKELKSKNNITTFLQTIQIHKSILRTWTQIFKKCTTNSNIHNKENSILIKIDNKYTTIDKVKYRDYYYWHFIKYKHYTPKTTKTWSITYPDFDNAEQKIWSKIFELPFKCCRETKIQNFQFRIIHRIIFCNSWLKQQLKTVNAVVFVMKLMISPPPLSITLP